MSTLEILHLGNPLLRLKSRAVTKSELRSKEFQDFLDALCETCIVNNGAGMAASQVGVNKRVIVVHVDPTNPRYPGKKPFPMTIVVNPSVTWRSKKIEEDWEGDLSVPLRGLVPRPNACTVVGLDREGKKVGYELGDSFHARVFLHEIDHLSGVLMIDRVKRKDTLSELPEWEKYWKHQQV